MTGQENCDFLIHVSALAGLTVYNNFQSYCNSQVYWWKNIDMTTAANMSGKIFKF